MFSDLAIETGLMLRLVFCSALRQVEGLMGSIFGGFWSIVLFRLMPDRCMPEYKRILAGLGGALPYRRAWALLAELLPLDTAPEVEAIRRRTL